MKCRDCNLALPGPPPAPGAQAPARCGRCGARLGGAAAEPSKVIDQIAEAVLALQRF